jgi:serine/threonine-protein kinase RsbT
MRKSKNKNKQERIEISENAHVDKAISATLKLAETAGFDRTAQSIVATTVSELANNILSYAQTGKITIRILERKKGKGIEIVAEDNGPGMADIPAAMRDGFSTSGSFGVGLPGAKRMMDEFEVDSERGVRTRITARKWV